MKQFWNIVLGSFVGVWIALMLFSVISVFMSFAFMGAMSMIGKAPAATITDNSVLHLDLGCTVNERTAEDDFMSMLINSETVTVGLDEILCAIDAAKTDDRIDGIYIECNGISAGTASLYEIRNALINFKNESGKLIYAYGDNIPQSDYYLASVADSLYINTIGSIDLRGLAVTIPFYKNLLDKIGVEMQIVRVGTFKSAVEPYILTKISEANKLQYETFTSRIWGNMVNAISTSRGIEPSKLSEMTDSIVFLQETKYLVDNGLADVACYKHEFDDRLKMAVHGDTESDVNFVSPRDLANVQTSNSGDGNIAIVYAVGEIYDAGDEGINSAELAETILELADDDEVAGVVLRVNSPGGSAYGSEQIWEALQKVKQAGKPLAVSMGDMAASGGYYISCGADRIFAEPTTLTGSIGVFGMIPCMKELFEDKLGINQSVVKTNANSEFPMLNEKMTPAQRTAMQRMVNKTYELFVGRCAEGRNMPADSIKMIAEGRVWDGISAKEIGLVDEFGNLEDATEWVAAKAGINGSYNVIIAPVQKDFFTKYISKYINQGIEEKLQQEMGPMYQYRNEIKQITSRSKILCLTPEIVIK